ncbi:hypothetical protein FRB96_008427 [Tulasnella sp. 330]|nr:hypothetical protein FRB96_008427 [Tulasnella sp. 330]
MASTPPRAPATQRSDQKGYLGFLKRFDFGLWLFFGGVTFFFSLSRLSQVFPEVLMKRSPPGDWFWYSQKYYQRGMQLHLATVLPCGILSVFQFVPALRNRYPQVHRISGRIAFRLLYISMIGAFMIAPHAIGGALSLQSFVGALSAMSGFAVFKSWASIRRRQVGEHRKWSLRAMFYIGSAITARVVLIATVVIATNLTTRYTVFRCDELEFTLKQFNVSDTFSTKYPTCQGAPAWSVVPVKATLPGSPEEIGSALRLSFGSACWLALMIHAIGVEYYINYSSSMANNLITSASPGSEFVQDVHDAKRS